MPKQGAMGLILDREQLCAALAISDSAITAWEKKGMPIVRRGRGRGMKSLYNYDAVRAWCHQTGLGQGIQALIARIARDVQAQPSPHVQTSGPAADPEEAYLDETLRLAPAIEIALLSLPALLLGVGLTEDAVTGLLDGLYAAMREELQRRHEPVQFVASELDNLRSMIEEERRHPGAWTGSDGPAGA